MKILYTGFAPFGGESVNPSFESLRLLPDSIAGADVLRLELPTSFDSAGKLLVEGIARERPDIVICVGQAGGRAAVTPEFVAINYRSARIPDNDGFQPTDEPVCGGGPVGYFTKLPVRRIAERCRENGIPASVSYTAGTDVCNNLMYTLLHAIETQFPAVTGGFIHVPYSAEQAAPKTPQPPSMDLGMIAAALRIAGEETLSVMRENAHPF